MLSEQNRSRTIGAMIALSVACLLWGSSFSLMQFGTTGFTRAAAIHAPQVSDLALRATYNAWRFGVAVIIYAAVIFRSLGRFNALELRAGSAVGTFFILAVTLQMIALRYCVPSLIAVLTSLVVIVTPVALMLFFGRRISRMVWLAALIALGGAVILAQPNPGSTARNTMTITPPFHGIGELLMAVVAVFGTAQVLIVDRFGARTDARRMTLMMFIASMAISVVLSFALGGAPLYTGAFLSAVLHDAACVASTAGLIVFTSITANYLMNHFQPRIPATAAAVLYCLEPVFAMGWSVVLGTETLTLITLSGASLIISAVVLSALASKRAER
jgi:drug/metabolite transporter (DMT)-like permease